MQLARILAFLSIVSMSTACVVRTGHPHRAERRAEHRDDRRDARLDASSPWDKLGERWVRGRADHDVIKVGRDEGRYRQIKLVVEHSALELYDVVVVFGDGTRFSPETRMIFGNGTTSRTIDLPGGNRVIRRIEFRYGNLPGGGKAQVEAWAI
jgi:hypothetical protein